MLSWTSVLCRGEVFFSQDIELFRHLRPPLDTSFLLCGSVRVWGASDPGSWVFHCVHGWKSLFRPKWPVEVCQSENAAFVYFWGTHNRVGLPTGGSFLFLFLTWPKVAWRYLWRTDFFWLPQVPPNKIGEYFWDNFPLGLHKVLQNYCFLLFAMWNETSVSVALEFHLKFCRGGVHLLSSCVMVGVMLISGPPNGANMFHNWLCCIAEKNCVTVCANMSSDTD